MRIETLPSVLSGKYQRQLLHDQFLLAKRPDIIPETWRQDSVSGWTLGTHPSLPVSPIKGPEGVTQGWVIGYAIDPSRHVVDGAGVAFPTLTDSALASVHERLAGFGGRYVIVLLDGAFQRVYLDPCGSLGTVYCSIEEVVASTSCLIPYSNATADNILLQKALRMPHNFSNGYPVGLTPRHQVRRLLPNHYLDLGSWEAERFWPKGEFEEVDVEAAVGEIADIVMGQTSAILSHDRVQMALTAGQDSRVLLACARKYVQEIEFFTYAVPDVTGRVDVRIASRIAERLGLKHRILGHIDASVVDLEVWLYKTGCEVSGLRGWKEIRTIGQLRPDRLEIHSVGGELARDFWWRKEDSPFSPITLGRLAQQCGALLIPEVRSSLQAWLDSLPPIRNFFTILHLFYIEQRLGCWGGVHPYGEAGCTIFKVYPFSHRRIFELMLSLPVSYKRERRFWKDIAEREWSDLLTVPVNPRTRLELWEDRTRAGVTRAVSALKNPRPTIGRIAQRYLGVR